MRLLRGTFQGRDYSIGPLTIENSVDNPHFIFCFSFQIYPSQTKILEGRTNLSERDFEALFKGVSTRFGLQNVEKCFEIAF
jgi:hypothetical protein